MLKFAVLSVLTLAAAHTWACSCANPGRSIWESGGFAHVVRIERVEAGKVSFGNRSNCASNPDDCYPAQVAQYVELERIGNGPPLAQRLVSGYGAGDCGLPLLAGTVFVVFQSSPDGQVGICNALGPYRSEDLNPKYESELRSFIESLRQAVAQPGHKVLSAPESMQMGSWAIPPPPPPLPPPSGKSAE